MWEFLRNRFFSRIFLRSIVFKIFWTPISFGTRGGGLELLFLAKLVNDGLLASRFLRIITFCVGTVKKFPGQLLDLLG